jgi:hypothetical protein
MKGPRGHTLLEQLVGMGLLSGLMLMMFFIYQYGASAWKKGETETDLLQESQKLVARLQREAERSVYASASLDPGPNAGTAVAFLSCWDDATERFDVDPATGRPMWHEYHVFYYDGPSREVRWKRVPVAPTVTPVPLAALAGERNGGRVLARDVVRCDFQLSEQLLGLELEIEKKRYGTPTPERIQLPVLIYLRN